MQLKFISITVEDQEHALDFYTNVLVFEDTCGNLINLVQPAAQP